jgi:hypothetical protein
MDFKVVMTIEFPGIPPDEDVFNKVGDRAARRRRLLRLPMMPMR